MRRTSPEIARPPRAADRRAATRHMGAAPTRRRANPTAWAEDASIHCGSSTATTTGERLAAWRLQTQALAAAAQGDAAGATLQLQAAVTRLIDLGEHELAAATAATADQLAATGSVEPGQAKELRYATRRLTDGG